ncbi:hypothetical protein GOP47_0020435 [Adiantum capillus-veneris]|uniref:BHLH domain-containing protein n=1 Tax=Adiantum capillus-veneris TaxID=13818 RepID=A0A9D4Z8E0_ADICA|nr:hypothetical protein GOP47_0020149 [Adiantum capillus-veneris]KAI5065740.1 hypothetical protein GOP47_0020435 [Adiantum capillus-veneris]
MSHCVPNLDVRSAEIDDVRPCPLPSEKGEVASLFFCDGGGLEYSSARKSAGTCIHAPWMETENEEKRANVFEMSRELGSALDVTLSHTPFQEDEMLSWLQYPLDDTFSKNYCTEQQCQQVFPSFPSQSLLQKAPGERLSASSLSTKLSENTDHNIVGQSVTTDAALVLGSQRAAGLVPQAGAQVFDRVHTIKQSCDDAKATGTLHIPNVNPSASENAGNHNKMNFPFFSQKVAAIKSSVQIVGTSNGPSMKDRLCQCAIRRSNERMSSIEKSAPAASLTSFNSLGESELNEPKQGTDITQEPLHNLRCDDDKARQAEVDLTAYTPTIGTEFFESADVTLTSLSGESDYSTGKSAKDAGGKRPAEETECESKDTRGLETGPTMARTISAKRTRAAEVHNQSERRRRNKINEKMKALQELIPNANKTDKASMLDEAIEYVKMLQAQLQLMSTRTGMIVPPIMMPPGMQYLSLQQRPSTTGLNMGLGSRVMDASTTGVSASARAVFLGQPSPGQVYQPMAGYPVMPEVQSHLHLNAMRNAQAFPHFQPGHLQRINDIYKANEELGKRQQG